MGFDLIARITSRKGACRTGMHVQSNSSAISSTTRLSAPTWPRRNRAPIYL